MKVAEATIASQGQVTIPAKVRRDLGLAERQKVACVTEDDAVRLAPPRHTLESAFGTVPPSPARRRTSTARSKRR